MTKRELKEYCWIKANINDLEERLVELETQAQKMTTTLSLDPGGGCGYQDKMAKAVAEVIECQDMINTNIIVMRQLERKIEEAIEVLPEREKYLMRLRYIRCLTWEQVVEKMGYSWVQTHHIHGQALYLIQNPKTE